MHRIRRVYASCHILPHMCIRIVVMARAHVRAARVSSYYCAYLCESTCACCKGVGWIDLVDCDKLSAGPRMLIVWLISARKRRMMRAHAGGVGSACTARHARFQGADVGDGRCHHFLRQQSRTFHRSIQVRAAARVCAMIRLQLLFVLLILGIFVRICIVVVHHCASIYKKIHSTDLQTMPACMCAQVACMYVSTICMYASSHATSGLLLTHQDTATCCMVQGQGRNITWSFSFAWNVGILALTLACF